MKWLALLLVLFVLSPALIARGGELRQATVKRSEFGALATIGAARIGVRVGVRLEWRMVW